MRRVATLLISCLTLVAACSKGPTAGQTAAPAPKPAASMVPAALFSKPHPKAGLWETTMSTSAGPGMRMSGEMCLDAQTEQAAFATAPQSSTSRDCSPPTFGPGPAGGMVFDATCRTKGRTVTTHGVATGDFSSAYTLDITTKMDPPPPGMDGGARIQIQAKWLGPCKPGQKPGHVSMRMTGLGQG